MTSKEYDKIGFSGGMEFETNDGRVFSLDSADFEDKTFIHFHDNGIEGIFHCEVVKEARVINE